MPILDIQTRELTSMIMMLVDMREKLNTLRLRKDFEAASPHLGDASAFMIQAERAIGDGLRSGGRKPADGWDVEPDYWRRG